MFLRVLRLDLRLLRRGVRRGGAAAEELDAIPVAAGAATTLDADAVLFTVITGAAAGAGATGAAV